MAWFVIDMPGVSMTDGVYHRFCREFQRAFIEAGAPPDLALFAQRNCTTESRRLFLSPTSQTYIPDLISGYEARPCMVPDPASVTLVYGVPGARNLLDSQNMAARDAPAKRNEIPTIYPLSRSRSVASGG